MGVAFLHESDLYDFFRRSETQGGLGINPITTNLGYQFEGQYIGTENFGLIQTPILNPIELNEIVPNGPLLNNAFSIKSSANNLWATYGDYTLAYAPGPKRRRGFLPTLSRR